MRDFRLVSGVCLAIMALAGSTPLAAGADTFPSKPLRLVVPYFPGGSPDIHGRRIAEKLRQRLSQPIIVDNRPGANAIIGMGLVARAPADGYTIVIAPVGPWAVNPHLYKLPFDPLTDLAPVIHATSTPGVLVVHPSVPVRSVKELIAYAKAHSGELNYGSTGIGGFGHICGELFDAMAGTKMTHVPHRSVAASVTAVVGGHVNVLFNVAGPTIPHIRSERIRGLATTGATRMEQLPDLPTISEAGVPGYENATWNAMGVPARTPRPIIDLLNREINAVLQMPDVKEAMRTDNSMVVGGTPEDFKDYLAREYAKYGKLIREVGIKAEGD